MMTNESAPQITLSELLKKLAELGGSDLHITTNTPPQVRVDGHLRPLEGYRPLSSADTKQLAYSVLTDAQKHRFEENLELDFSFGVKGLSRFRANIFNQRGAVGAVFRAIPYEIKPFEKLGLPPVVKQLCDKPRGLILVTGPTGSGKSTTLAAMIDRINATRSGHIVTIEDPIEFLHRDKRSFISQREVDVDTRSFAEALRGALRQDPDVILVGEMRDYETIETALAAAETGHLVLSTLHTLDATETITRIVSSVPSHQQKSVRIQLAGILKAVVSMRLVRAARGTGRVPAIEIMVATGLIRDCIINEEKTSQIREAIAAGNTQYGMQTFDQSLFHLYQSGLITLEEALRHASNADEFRMRISGILSSMEQATQERERLVSVSNT